MSTVRNVLSVRIALLTTFIILVCIIIISVATKLLPLWLYISFSTLLATIIIVSIFLSSKDRCVALTYFFIIALALILWNLYAIATGYNMLAFRDSYQEFVHLRLILSEGHINIGARYPDLIISPGNSAYYPIFPALATIFTLTTGLEPLKVSILLPLAIAVFTLLSVALFAKELLSDSEAKNTALPLSVLAFAISPNMIVHSVFYYHRELAFGFYCMLLYFMLRYFSNNLNNTHKLLLIALTLLLPFTHSSYPYKFDFFLLDSILLIVLIRMLDGRRLKFANRMRPPILIFLMLLGMLFLWNFMFNYPSPVTGGLPIAVRNIIKNLLQPQLEAKVWEISSFSPMIPEVLAPQPWIILPRVRSFLLDISLFIVGFLLMYKVIKNKASYIEFLGFIVMASFALYMIIGFLSWWDPFIFRTYMFPLIAYSTGILFGFLMNSKVKIIKFTASVIIIFLVVMAFLAPFGSIYSRQLYDSAIKYDQADFPSPSYIYLREFIAINLIEGGVFLSDFEGFLTVILPLNQLGQIKSLIQYYNRPDTYIFEFVGLRFGAGIGDINYSFLEHISPEMEDIRANVGHDYDRVVDAKAFVVHYKPL
jgi:hypothetical protein